METGGNLNGKVLNPLVDFDFIVNTELGLIRFIRENYQDDRAFKLDVLNKSDREILSLLSSRTNPNPISIISTEENMNDIDDLYNSFFETHKLDIIKRSTAEQSTMRFMNLMIDAGYNYGINGYIAVKDELERSEIISHFGRANIIEKSDKHGILSKDPFYVRDYRFFIETNIVDEIKQKKIYIPPKTYSLNYFEYVENRLTRNNVFVLTGKDYRLNKGENNNNGHSTQ